MSFQEDPEVQRLFIESVRRGKEEDARLKSCGIDIKRQDQETIFVGIEELMANECS